MSTRPATGKDLLDLLSQSKTEPTPTQKEQQRRSFVYGNTKIENGAVTRQIVDEVAEKLARDGKRP